VSGCSQTQWMRDVLVNTDIHVDVDTYIEIHIDICMERYIDIGCHSGFVTPTGLTLRRCHVPGIQCGRQEMEWWWWWGGHTGLVGEPCRRRRRR